jgi:GNAT superfamily N-acetyltransferase
MADPIRPTIPADIDPLVELTRQTGVFKPHEMQALAEVLVDYFAANRELEHHCVTYETAGQILGFAYYAPAAMTDRTWYLYWIAVSQKTQAKGIGSALLRFVEDNIRHLRGRQLLIETSSLPHYDLTRRFYLKHTYELAASVPDYYADGDDMAIFRKRL